MLIKLITSPNWWVQQKTEVKTECPVTEMEWIFFKRMNSERSLGSKCTFHVMSVSTLLCWRFWHVPKISVQLHTERVGAEMAEKENKRRAVLNLQVVFANEYPDITNIYILQAELTVLQNGNVRLIRAFCLMPFISFLWFPLLPWFGFSWQG